MVREMTQPDLPVYKMRLTEHDNKPRVLNQSLLLPLLTVQQNKPELDEEKSSMGQEDTVCKVSLTHSKHDDDSVDKGSGSPWYGNAANDMSNAPAGPVTSSKSKGHSLTAKDFINTSQGVNWLTNSWKMFPAGLEDLSPVM